MRLKLFVLSASSVVLWLVPLAILDKTLNIHKVLQGLSLTSAIACAVAAGNMARQQAEEDEIEAIKSRAITADVIDEISTSAYVSQQQRQQEAEAILTFPGEDVEASRQALEAIYSANLQKGEAENVEVLESDKSLTLEVQKALEGGKSTTWIIENVLKMGGVNLPTAK